ncbi:hypothetical protein [Occultella glacieicola]|nr:hypothetical protein [Occultella glacieicola]
MLIGAAGPEVELVVVLAPIMGVQNLGVSLLMRLCSRADGQSCARRGVG